MEQFQVLEVGFGWEKLVKRKNREMVVWESIQMGLEVDLGLEKLGWEHLWKEGLEDIHRTEEIHYPATELEREIRKEAERTVS